MLHYFNQLIDIKSIIIYHFIPEGTRESHPSVHDLQINTPSCEKLISPFYTPVFRRDVLWYGNVCPSVRVSVRPSQFSAFFSYMLWYIELNFVYDFILMYVKSSSNTINFRLFLQELCPIWTSNSYKYAVFSLFSYMLRHIELKFCIWLYFNVPQIECCHFASIYASFWSLGNRNIGNTQLSAFFSKMLRHI